MKEYTITLTHDDLLQVILGMQDRQNILAEAANQAGYNNNGDLFAYLHTLMSRGRVTLAKVKAVMENPTPSAN